MKFLALTQLVGVNSGLRITQMDTTVLIYTAKCLGNALYNKWSKKKKTSDPAKCHITLEIPT